jgi:hypothetical protein
LRPSSSRCVLRRVRGSSSPLFLTPATRSWARYRRKRGESAPVAAGNSRNRCLRTLT